MSEYLIYGLFGCSDRPDGALFSKRWVGLEDLLEHGGVGNIQAKIDEWEGARAARYRATVGAVFEAADPRAERRATHIWVRGGLEQTPPRGSVTTTL